MIKDTNNLTNENTPLPSEKGQEDPVLDYKLNTSDPLKANILPNKKGISTHSNDGRILLETGAHFLQHGNLQQGLGLLYQALQCDDIKTESAIIIGNTFYQFSQFDRAIEAYDKAIASNSNSSIAHANKGATLLALGKLTGALQNATESIRLNRSSANNYYNRGLIFLAKRNAGRAIYDFKKATQISPHYKEAFFSLSTAFLLAEDLENALSAIERALEIDPLYGEAYSSKAELLTQKMAFEEAESTLQNAKSLIGDNNDINYSLAKLQLLLGHTKNGWLNHEARKRKTDAKNYLFCKLPEISNVNQNSRRTIFVYSEQGLGDIIQFSIYLKRLDVLGWSISFSAPQNMKRLLGSISKNINFKETIEPQNKFDECCALMSLPLAFGGIEIHTPNQTPYITAENSLIEKWAQRIGKSGFKIGICWQGSNNNIDIGRSFPVSSFRRISHIPNVRLISLHKGAGEEQLKKLPSDMVVETLGPDFDVSDDAFVDTAAVMMCCDLIISSDTAVAHLAGALGVPNWVALKQVPDWRWMMDRSDSPWYPTMRLFRQKSRGNWNQVFIEIETALWQTIRDRDADIFLQ